MWKQWESPDASRLRILIVKIRKIQIKYELCDCIRQNLTCNGFYFSEFFFRGVEGPIVLFNNIDFSMSASASVSTPDIFCEWKSSNHSTKVIRHHTNIIFSFWKQFMFNFVESLFIYDDLWGFSGKNVKTFKESILNPFFWGGGQYFTVNWALDSPE